MPDATPDKPKGGEPEKKSEIKPEKTPEELEKEKLEEVLDDSTYEPTVRKTVADYVADRRGEKIVKLEKELENKEDEEPEEELDKEKVNIAELVSKKVQEVLNPVLSHIVNQTDEAELTTFLSKPENSQFKRFEKLARKDMKVYPTVPIEKIFRSLAYDEAMTAGATKSEEHKKKTEKSKVSGTSMRETTPNVPDFSKMTPKEVADYNKEILKGKIVKVEE